MGVVWELRVVWVPVLCVPKRPNGDEALLEMDNLRLFAEDRGTAHRCEMKQLRRRQGLCVPDITRAEVLTVAGRFHYFPGIEFRARRNITRLTDRDSIFSHSIVGHYPTSKEIDW